MYVIEQSLSMIYSYQSCTQPSASLFDMPPERTNYLWSIMFTCMEFHQLGHHLSSINLQTILNSGSPIHHSVILSLAKHCSFIHSYVLTQLQKANVSNHANNTPPNCWHTHSSFRIMRWLGSLNNQTTLVCEALPVKQTWTCSNRTSDDPTACHKTKSL